MSSNQTLRENDVKSLAGNTICPSCSSRILLLSLNKHYYCPNCNDVIAVHIKEIPSIKWKLINEKIRFILQRVYINYRDKLSKFISLYYPLILTIIYIISAEENKDNILDTRLGLTFYALFGFYLIATIAVAKKALPNILGSIFAFTIIIAVLSLFGIPPQISVVVLGILITISFGIKRCMFIKENWHPFVVSIFLIISSIVPLIICNNYNLPTTTISSLIIFLYHSIIANICLVWLSNNSYPIKKSILLMGITPLMIAMFILPFIGKIDFDLDGLFETDTAFTEPSNASGENTSVFENSTTDSVAAEGSVEATELASFKEIENNIISEMNNELGLESQEIIVSPKSKLSPDIASNYYIETTTPSEYNAKTIAPWESSGSDFFYYQQSPDTCAIANQRAVISEQLGIDYPETYLQNYATKCGYYQPGGGTNLLRTGSLLEDAGLEVFHSHTNSLEEIDMALQDGYSVTVNLDPQETSYPIYDLEGNPIEQEDNNMGHNVKVDSLIKDQTGKVEYVVIDDPDPFEGGPNKKILAKDFLNANNDYINTIFAKAKAKVV